MSRSLFFRIRSSKLICWLEQSQDACTYPVLAFCQSTYAPHFRATRVGLSRIVQFYHQENSQCRPQIENLFPDLTLVIVLHLLDRSPCEAPEKRAYLFLLLS